MTSQPAAAAATAAIQRVAGYPLYAIFGITHLGAALQRPNLPVVCHQPARHFPTDAPACSQNKYLAAAVHPLSPFANGCLTAYLRLISNEIAYHHRAAIHFCMNTSIPREWYRTFLAVLQEGSLSGASRTLNITQPTAGRHAGLEAALGRPYLPARKPACWRPTRRWRCGCRGDGQHRPGAGTHGGQL